MIQIGVFCVDQTIFSDPVTYTTTANYFNSYSYIYTVICEVIDTADHDQLITLWIFGYKADIKASFVARYS